MKKAQSNPLRQELIGLNIEVVSSKNPQLCGLKGKIIDETKNTIKVETNKGKKTILKNQITIKMKIKENTYEIEGNYLVGRPEDRIKK